MKHRIQLFILLLLVSSLLVAACGEDGKEASEPGIVPSELQTIEAAAEDIIDFAPSGNWERIGKDTSEIETAWKSYQPQAIEDGASQELEDSMIAAIAKSQTASASKDAPATMQSANDVSAAVVELFALYHPAVPADIGRLDVLERQVILDVSAKDYSAAMKSLTKIKLVWENVKPCVLEHDGKDVADEFEANLAAQESALNAKDDAALADQAKNGSEIVDELEQLY